MHVTSTIARVLSRTVSVAAVLLTACDSDLQRDDALRLLVEAASSDTAQSRLSWRKGAYEEWTARGGRNSKRLAPGISIVTSGDVQFEPRPRVVIEEVTGIAKVPVDEASRLVVFRWHLDVPRPYERLVVSRGSGSALITRFDDGWRVSRSSITRSDSTGALLVLASTADSAEIRDDIQQLQAAIAASKTPTRELYSATTVRRGFRGEVIGMDTIVITNADLKWTGYTQRVWLRCINAVVSPTLSSPAGVSIVIPMRWSYLPECNIQEKYRLTIDDEQQRITFVSTLRRAIEEWQSNYSRYFEEPWER